MPNGSALWKQPNLLHRNTVEFQWFVGAPEGIRTPDPQIRSLVLYPAELPARASPRSAIPGAGQAAPAARQGAEAVDVLRQTGWPGRFTLPAGPGTRLAETDCPPTSRRLPISPARRS